MITLSDITRSITTANDDRLNGIITRQQHAAIIARYNRVLVANGYTWSDVETTFAQTQKGN
jgi:hypothetical protein